MKQTSRFAGFGLVALAATVVLSLPAAAQWKHAVPAGQTAFTFVNRLLINPPQIMVYGYLGSIEGISDPVFSGAPSENTAYFTWTLDAAGATLIPNGDATVAVLPSGHTLNLYYNAAPSRNWGDPSSFSTGELVATFRAGVGTQTGIGPLALVTQSYVLVSTSNFSLNGEIFNFAKLLPHGFTMMTESSNIPLMNATPAPPALVFAAGGSAIAIGGSVSTLPN